MCQSVKIDDNLCLTKLSSSSEDDDGADSFYKSLPDIVFMTENSNS